MSISSPPDGFADFEQAKPEVIASSIIKLSVARRAAQRRKGNIFIVTSRP
jgi:hypothetical protein